MRSDLKKRLVCLILCMLVSLPVLTGCGGGTTPETEKRTEDTTPLDITSAETETTRANTKDSLPDDLRFDDMTIDVFGFGWDSSVWYDTTGGGELTGDVVLDAMVNRNITVEERLGVKFNWIIGSDDWNGFPNAVKTALLAGASDYDFVVEENSRLFEQSVQGFYYDLATKPYIDLSQPWWYNDLMEQSSLDNNKRYFLAGDICLTTLLGASAMYFNKPLFIDHFGDTQALYDTVLEGKWTYDVFMQYCRDIATDVNGDGVYDDSDLLGFRYSQWGIPNYLSMSIGLDYITRDADGFPVLDIYNEESIKWADTLYRLLYTENMSAEGATGQTFLDEKSLFYPGMFSTANDLRQADFDYGILPYPKLEESFSYYSGAAPANGCGIGVPVSAPAEKLDAVYASIEALCAESYRKVTPAWYDTALKVKYADAAIDAEMIDLIYDNIKSPFIMMADKAIGTGSIFTNAVYGSKSEGTFASYWEKNGKNLETKLSGIIEKYKELDLSGN